MKTSLKWISITLSAMMLIQSCTIYRSKTSTLDEVILADKEVKVINKNGEKYKFSHLYSVNDTVYGITSSKHTIKLLSDNIVERNIRGGFHSKIVIPTDQINEYQIKDNTLTTIANIGILIVIFFSGLVIYVIYNPPTLF